MAEFFSAVDLDARRWREVFAVEVVTGQWGEADALNKAEGTADLPPLWMLAVRCREGSPPWTRP